MGTLGDYGHIGNGLFNAVVALSILVGIMGITIIGLIGYFWMGG